MDQLKQKWQFNMNYPIDDFSKNLLCSIPKKIKYMISSSGLNLNTISHNSLNADFSKEDNGEISIGETVIRWEGDIESPSQISSNNAKFTDIKSNLDDFVIFETALYQQVYSYILSNRQI